MIGPVPELAGGPETGAGPAECLGRKAGGRAAYGYRVEHRDGVAVLQSDPLTAPVVRRVFREYLAGDGLMRIAERLTQQGVVVPSAHDPSRNRHHEVRAWSKSMVRSLIINPRYTGGACARSGDPELAGPCTRRCGPALVSAAEFDWTQQLLGARGRRREQHPDAAAGDVAGPDAAGADRYLLRGLLRCDLCQRKMQGSWNNRAAYYRCRLPREYARANGIDHPTNVYVREDRMVDGVMSWVCDELPPRLEAWARHRPARQRSALSERVDALRVLIRRAIAERERSTELFRALELRLLYDAPAAAVQIRVGVLPGAVFEDRVALR